MRMRRVDSMSMRRLDSMSMRRVDSMRMRMRRVDSMSMRRVDSMRMRRVDSMRMRRVDSMRMSMRRVDNQHGERASPLVAVVDGELFEGVEREHLKSEYIQHSDAGARSAPEECVVDKLHDAVEQLPIDVLS